jgi:glutathione S-transferase
MKLYDSRRAPNPRRVRWVMAEKGIEDIEIVDVDLFGGAHRKPDYLAEVGVANVPALVLDDGTAVTESVAIGRYLESLYPEPNLFGRDAREVAVIEMWTRRAENGLATPLMMGVRLGAPLLAALEKNQSPEVSAWNTEAARRAINLFDRRLSESAFIAADRITIADICAFTALDFARMIKFQPPEDRPHFLRWAQAMRERPAALAGV